MIIATAGHIDHGKTQLVKALTGIDTDRLAEEKARGISIDLGFAYLRVFEERLLGFIDVPGHARFVHNMLAGVCGIDFAMLVIAADDGVMPQTVEHLQILDLLGVERGVVVISKIDRASPDRVVQVEGEARDLLAGSTLAASECLPVSAATGEGIEALRRHLTEAARTVKARIRPGQNFRLAVDRSFSIRGSGTVVTGTVFSGEVRTGETVTISPRGLRARVRAIQVNGSATDCCHAGERCAINLQRIEVESVTRGDWLVHETAHNPTQRVDVKLSLMSSELASLKHWTAVRLHLGTCKANARIATRRGASIQPGETAWAQLVTSHPISAINGDRFIIRDVTGTRTLGGGTIVNPFAVQTPNNAPRRMAMLEALAEGDPTRALAELLAIPDRPIDCLAFERTFNLSARQAATLYQSCGAIVLGRGAAVALTRARAASLIAEVTACLAAFLRDQPEAPGLELRSIHRRVAPWLSPEAFGLLVKDAIEARRIAVVGTCITLPGHSPSSTPDDQAMWARVEPLLDQAGLSPPRVRDIALSIGVEEGELRDFLHRRSKAGALMCVGDERFYPTKTLAVLAANAALVARASSRGLFTVAQYRDVSGVNRKLAIDILEHFDKLGITQRLGNVRRMHLNFVPILGPAKPKPASLSAKAAGRGLVRSTHG